MAAHENLAMRYICSYDMLELTLCLLFAGLGSRLPYLWQPSKRMGVPHYETTAPIIYAYADENGSQSSYLFDLGFDRISGEETVSTTMLAILGIVLPFVIQCILALLEMKWRRRIVLGDLVNDTREEQNIHAEDGLECMIANRDKIVDEKCSVGQEIEPDTPKNAELSWSGTNYFFFHTSICRYATTLGMSLLFIESIKRYVGYLRPNFYQLCGPEYGTEEGELVCNNDASGDTDIERYQSFPSGHASVAYSGLTLLSLYLGRSLGIPHETGFRQTSGRFILFSRHVRLRRLLCFISILMVQSLALWISTSRIVDQLHHPADVVGGAITGAGCAWFADGLWVG